VRPRRTARTTTVFRLDGGTEDNDLFVERITDADGCPVLISTWEPSPDERAAIAAGARIQLHVWGAGHPPVALSIEE
jgi:glycerol kinase